MRTYEIVEFKEGFYVGFRDENGEWWDSCLDPFETKEEAEFFRDELQKDEDFICLSEWTFPYKKKENYNHFL